MVTFQKKKDREKAVRKKILTRRAAKHAQEKELSRLVFMNRMDLSEATNWGMGAKLLRLYLVNHFDFLELYYV